MAVTKSAAKVSKGPIVGSSPPEEIRDRLYRFSLEQIHKMAEVGILGPSDRVELLEGWVVCKMVILPPYASSVRRLCSKIPALLPVGWIWQSQQPLTLKDSEPEPDFAVMIGPIERYDLGHPGPRDLGVVVEVADSSLRADQGIMLRTYAAARIPVYWIVNLVDRRVEVYSLPRAGKSPTYREVRHFGPDESVPLVIAGVEVGTIAVADLLP